MSLISNVLVDGVSFKTNLDGGQDLSIPLSFSDRDPSLYGTPHATHRPFTADGLIGDTRLGGSCNVATIELTPHCNGTHTECVGHVTTERRFIHELLPTGLIPCTLISVTPESILLAGETSVPPVESEDILGLTARCVASVLGESSPSWRRAVIIRTLPNLDLKKSAQHTSNGVPFFTVEAIELLKRTGVEHILVDLPSLDRLHDHGKMAAHRTWWNIDSDSFDQNNDIDALRTITELIFVPDSVEDGLGFVSIQIPPFCSDAAPSRPIFFSAYPA